MDRIHRWIDGQAELRLTAAEVTLTARALCALHDLSGEVAADFCRVLAGGLLLASELKSFQTFSLQVDRLDRTYHVDATPEGLVRGMVGGRGHEASTARVAVRRFGQKGLIYQSVVDVPGRDVGTALEEFVARSDQQSVRLDMRVELDRDGAPERVRGAWLRGFPSTPPEVVAELFERWDALDGAWLPDEPSTALGWRRWDELDRRDVDHHCPCSRERAFGSLVALGREEIETAASQGEEFELFCDFCRSEYRIPAAEVLETLG